MSKPPIVPVILCGGAGSRLWPASRESFPKQFAALFGSRSIFQTTLERVRTEDFAAPLIVTHADFRFLVEAQMREIGVAGALLIEPERRDSAPAIAAACAYLHERAPGALALILASDHLITDVEGFRAAVRQAAGASAERIVAFGMRPDRPHTGYGYIAPGEALGGGLHTVARFVEKPDAPTAARYIAEGYLWNAGMFLFAPTLLAEELARFEPAVAEAAHAALQGAKRDGSIVRLDPAAFARAPRKSIDYAVMERTARAAVLPAAFGWSDIGGWAAVWDASSRDADGNVLIGPARAHGSRNCLVRSSGSLTVAVGLEDVLIVVEDDSVLVVGREDSERVKDAVAAAKADGHPASTASRKVRRPWGHYESLDLGARHQVKRIVVEPGAKLSLQSHRHRAEHWVVVAGTALVTRDAEEHLLTENQSIYLPLGCKHRLANPGDVPLVLIEVQSGDYLGEDDIVRYEDVYGRA